MTIASEITRLQNAKASIEASIEGKGITVPNTAKLDEYYSYIDQISWGDDDIISYMSGILSINSWLISISSSDAVTNPYSDYDYKDDNYLFLIKPYMYEDYSSSWHSYNRNTFSCIALPKWWSSINENSFVWYNAGWYQSSYIDYYGFYKEWNVVHFTFYGESYEYSYNKTYWKVDITFINGTWASTQSTRDWTTPSKTGGDMNLFNATLVWSLRWSGSFYIQWKPN